MTGEETTAGPTATRSDLAARVRRGVRGVRPGVRVLAACGVVALIFGMVSGPAPHRTWGITAALGYGAAALVAGRPAARISPAVVAATGAVALPLLLLVATDRAQLEADVVRRSGELLTATGNPYVPEPRELADYNPYLPGMALLGALPGDVRWWLGAAFLAALSRAVRRGPMVVAIAACPLVALPLAVGSADLPVTGLMCLGLALAGQAGRAAQGWSSGRLPRSSGPPGPRCPWPSPCSPYRTADAAH
ncbi:hypothetical protein ACFXKG_27495 [Streptomyces sp. NPDC059255]|uniref:hypothetical protein n=1 Tax=Streptomyces sp. NPDC059255 TaxID=3346793 RepID=UPI003698DC8A